MDNEQRQGENANVGNKQPPKTDKGSGEKMLPVHQRRRVNLFLHVRVLLHYLSRVDPKLRMQAHEILKDCRKRNQSGDPAYKSLADSIERNIRATVGDTHWLRAQEIQLRSLSSGGGGSGKQSGQPIKRAPLSKAAMKQSAQKQQQQAAANAVKHDTGRNPGLAKTGLNSLSSTNGVQPMQIDPSTEQKQPNTSGISSTGEQPTKVGSIADTGSTVQKTIESDDQKLRKEEISQKSG